MTMMNAIAGAEPVLQPERLPIETPNLPVPNGSVAPGPGAARSIEPGDLTQDPIGEGPDPIGLALEPSVTAPTVSPLVAPLRLGDHSFVPVSTSRDAPGPMVDHAIVPVYRSPAIPSGGEPTSIGPGAIGNHTLLPIAFPDLPGSELSGAAAQGGTPASTAAVAIEPPHFNGDRLITAPVPDLPESKSVAVAPGGAVGAAILASVSGAVASQTHQLITAMASFGGEHANPLTSAIAQGEVDAARMTLAASLHYQA
jgi:hypothetical protein